MSNNFLEALGYIASFIVLISLLMSSIIKLRWINLLGSAIFSLYGFLIGAFPVGFMNLCICIINVYYLIKIYGTKEYFKILPIENDSNYLKNFLDFYHEDIKNYSDNLEYDSKNTPIGFYILRNLVPAGIFIASEKESGTLKIDLDFVIPEYRDFKIGTFIFENSKEYFLDKGYNKFICYSSNASHIKYLKKMNFAEASEDGVTCFVKSIK
ncbi:hypothetical protein [Clostridium sp. 'White wine YQ']|uniref:hypothetical protein n=1 Tax=Clostridium sp. 'White wine YQ' TaxID=3027474 RepID=UPI0023654878|nr:hypothetical protein [Clostridium sp. 'White wine YQ']MDD7794322.1 hypothetical protein [Clostridium sp. 'White wine YQ']